MKSLVHESANEMEISACRVSLWNSPCWLQTLIVMSGDMLWMQMWAFLRSAAFKISFIDTNPAAPNAHFHFITDLLLWSVVLVQVLGHSTHGWRDEILISLFLLYCGFHYLFILPQNGSMTYNLHWTQLPPKGWKHIVGSRSFPFLTCSPETWWSYSLPNCLYIMNGVHHKLKCFVSCCAILDKELWPLLHTISIQSDHLV